MQNPRRHCVSVIVVSVIVASMVLAEVGSEPNASELVRAIRRSEMWLHDCNSLHIRARARWTKTPEGIAKRRAEIKEEFEIDDPNETQFPGLRRTSETDLEIAADRKRVRYLTYDHGYWQQLKVWDGNELRIHEKVFHHEQEHYGLYSEIPERMFLEPLSCNYGWPRSQPHSFWYDKKDVNEVMPYYGMPEDFELVGREEYRGIPCHVLKLSGGPQGRRGPTRRWFVGQSDGHLYGIQTLQARRPSIEHWWSDYRQVVPGGWFPMKSNWCFYDSDWLGRSKLQSTCNVEVTDFHMNEPLSDELFVVSIEPGVKIQDMRSGELQIYKLAPTLLGKPIGPLEGIRLPTAWPGQGTPMLIVFIDFQQRPSRHGIEQLRRHLDKHMPVVVIQASPMPAETLAEWREKTELPLDVGVITGDPEAVRWSWAVRSLPWLILADGEHVVRAEGVGVDELAAKIAEFVPSIEDQSDPGAVTGHVTDPQGAAVSGVPVTEFRTDKTYVTGVEGTFVSAYGPSDERRFFYAVDKSRRMVGVGRLAPGKGYVQIQLAPARIVSGRVLDPEGRPVAGVQVAPLPVTNFHALTDSQGRFAVAWQPEWAGDLNEFFLMGRHAKRNLAALVRIDGDTETVEVTMEPALTLVGTVQEPDGTPIRGANVRLSLRKGWTCGTPVKGVVTDATGRYEFAALPQNQEYTNSARAEGFWGPGVTTGIINTIAEREAVGPIVLRRTNQSVSGLVVDEAGKAVANCSVGVRGDGQPRRDTKTDTQGRFTIDGICDGPLEVWGKLDNVLYGTVQTQAGQSDVKLVVRPIQ